MSMFEGKFDNSNDFAIAAFTGAMTITVLLEDGRPEAIKGALEIAQSLVNSAPVEVGVEGALGLLTAMAGNHA